MKRGEHGCTCQKHDLRLSSLSLQCDRRFLFLGLKISSQANTRLNRETQNRIVEYFTSLGIAGNFLSELNYHITQYYKHPMDRFKLNIPFPMRKKRPYG